jgi:phenylalanyl-tRNA synthetase beta subunit
MKSKYEKRAIELINKKIADKTCSDNLKRFYQLVDKSEQIELLCELAEEVEKDHKDNYTELLTKYNLALNQLNTLVGISYTKQEVKELLEKQRIMCKNAAKQKVVERRVLVGKGKGQMRWKKLNEIDEDSILNAKLEL